MTTTHAGLVALDAARLPGGFTVLNLPLLKLKRLLPAPSQVPVLCWGEQVVADSTAIMTFLDANAASAGGAAPPFFPPESAAVAAVEEESDSLLSPLLRYYSLYDDAGFARCLKQQARLRARCHVTRATRS